MMASQLLFAVINILITINLPSTWASANLTIIDWTTCKPRDYVICRCANDIMNNVIVRCRFTHLTDLNLIVSNPEDVVRLNISGNHIQEIPSHSFKHYSTLFYLSLSSNKIHTISQRAFSGLKRLNELNLEDNMIKQWDTTLIEQDLPNLIMLNVAQNIYWKPDQRILSLPKLKIIYLLQMQRNHRYWKPFRCYLVNKVIRTDKSSIWAKDVSLKIEEEVSPNDILSASNGCWQERLLFRDDYGKVIEENGFYFHCTMNQSNQFVSYSIASHNLSQAQGNLWFYLKAVESSYCWKSIQRIHIITLIEGICALVFNLIVIITTLRSRILRESVAHVLVANIAVGDLLISLYMIIITSTRQMMDAIEYDDFYLPYYCRIVGVFFLIGQFSSPLMSFIMTLERYLAVVYCMRPHIRITRRMAYFAMITVWSVCFSLAVSFMTSPKLSRTPDSMGIPLSSIDKKQVLVYIGGIGVILYILSIALYVHMYRDFQKTNQKTVQLQRENRLARRIALIMFTNVFFFILPLVVIFIVDNSKFIFRYIFSKTFGIVFLGFNSLLNPILFSFRNETFRNEFKRRCVIFRHSISP